MKSRHVVGVMPKEIPDAELDAVIAAAASFPDGAMMDDIANALAQPPPRRTLQRRLALLVERKRLNAEGKGRATRYRLPTPAPPATTAATRGDTGIPVSLDGEAIRRSITAPIQQRHPVGYNRAFLETYRPNETFYLPAEVRSRLMELGRSPGEELPAGTYIRQVFHRLLIDLSWNSSRLEGNTYSLLETERLLELGENAEGKDAREAQMILNHKAAIELLADQPAEIGFNRYTICNLHALLSDNLLADPQACGRLRARVVGITGTVFHPLEGPQVIEECFQQVLDTAQAIEDPFEQAFFAMVHLPYLQPFEDVNKRVSRLAANIPLIRRNLCPLSFVDVPGQAYVNGMLGVYELNRVELLRDVFVWAYERSCARYSAVRQSLGEPDPFRLHYRNLLGEAIRTVIRELIDKKSASAFFRKQAIEHVPQKDQARFVEVVETEIMSIHEGNMARYRLRPSEYQAWQKTWR